LAIVHGALAAAKGEEKLGPCSFARIKVFSERSELREDRGGRGKLIFTKVGVRDHSGDGAEEDHAYILPSFRSYTISKTV